MKAKKSILSIFISAALLFIFLGWSAVSAFSTAPQTPGNILFVKPGTSGTCTSWAEACELQIALSAAGAGDQIWVAAGTYIPSSSNRSTTFQLKSGVAIYGGFPVEGGDWETRDWETNITTLSGDIGGNSVEDNSYHVVTGSEVDETAVLDGFTISGGNANGNPQETTSTGGGMYNFSGSPSLSNVTFSSNSAFGGGGIFNHDHSSPSLSNVTFFSNHAENGGGMYNYSSSSPSLSNVTFSSNSAVYFGGGMYNDQSSPSLSNVTFSSNSADSGGGMHNEWGSSPSLSNVTFSGNSANNGGGMLNLGMFNLQGSASLSNVTFSNNTATDSGGGMYNDQSSPSLSNVTFSGNSAISGGGMYNYSNSSATVTNSILWGNNPEQIYNNLGSVTVTYSDVQGGYTGNGNINEDPLLGPLADNGGFTQTHALGAGSPAIDAGGSANCPTTDQRGAPRPFDGDGNGTATCDMGAYEYAAFSLTLTVAGSGSVTKDPDKLEYLWGDEVTLTAIAIPGWTFSSWGGDASGSDNPLTITIKGNTSITATFTQDEYTLTVIPSGSGTVSVDPLQPTYHYDDEVTLTATADPGWTFSSWSGDASGADNPLTITIEGNTSITATFTQDEYTLTVIPSGSGTVSVDPLQPTYHYDDEVTLTATADPGWTFSSWGGDASGSDNPLTVTINGDTNITATFTQDEYTLTVAVMTPSNSGTVSIDPIQLTYHFGDEVTLTASAQLGWTFVGWSGDATGADNPLTITIEGNTNITATFTHDEYTLTVAVTPIGSGTVSVDPIKATYHYGDEVTLTATADPGWTFIGWSGDATGVTNPLTITIEGNTSITAEFINFTIYLPLIFR